MFEITNVSLYLIQLTIIMIDKNRQANINGNGATVPGLGIHLSLASFSLNPCSQIYAFKTQAVPRGLTSYPNGHLNPLMTHYLLESGSYPVGHEVTQV